MSIILKYEVSKDGVYVCSHRQNAMCVRNHDDLLNLEPLSSYTIRYMGSEEGEDEFEDEPTALAYTYSDRELRNQKLMEVGLYERDHTGYDAVVVLTENEHVILQQIDGEWKWYNNDDIDYNQWRVIHEVYVEGWVVLKTV